MLSLACVEKHYGNTQAVRGVSLTVCAGEVLGLLGSNGAGKTTTLRMAVGLTAPDAGSVTVAALGSPRVPEVRRQIGYAPQAASAYEELTARENVELTAGLYGLHGARRQKAAADALARVGLSARADDRAGTFSVGMQRRLTLASAIVHGPRLLVLDEPSAGVDPQARRGLFAIVRGLREEGVAVLCTTHLMEEAEALCDRVAIMDRGALIAEGSVAELLAVVPLRAASRTRGAPERRPVQRTLEGLFLELTGREAHEP